MSSAAFNAITQIEHFSQGVRTYKRLGWLGFDIRGMRRTVTAWPPSRGPAKQGCDSPYSVAWVLTDDDQRRLRGGVYNASHGNTTRVAVDALNAQDASADAMRRGPPWAPGALRRAINLQNAVSERAQDRLSTCLGDPELR